MLNYLKELTQLCGISGDEGAVAAYLSEQITGFDGILEMRQDALGDLLVHKKGKSPAKRRVLVGAHMDEVGLIVTGLEPDGRLSVAPVGGIEPDAVLGRAVQIPGLGYGVISAVPVHKLSDKEKDEKPDWKSMFLDIGTKNAEETAKLLSPGTSAAFVGDWTELGGGRVTAKAIDDRFGCAVMLHLLKGELAYDTWFGFFVQEEIGLRGSRTAAFAVDPEAALILEATTAADLDGVHGSEAVCKLGGGPVVSFMDRSTIYDRAFYREAFAQAEALGIPCQTKTRIAGGNDAGAVHLTREGVRTMAISVPCRCLHTPSCTAQISDMEQSLLLAEKMTEKLQEV